MITKRILPWAIVLAVLLSSGGQAEEARPYQMISIKELHGLMARKADILVVDTFPAFQYRKKHLAGAKNFEFPNIPTMDPWDKDKTGGRSEADFAAFLGADPGKMLVFYCFGPECHRSHLAAAWAVKLGYKNVHRLREGIIGWQKAGYPTEKSP
jgi:rhodanese-related sulfurtransferase